MPVAETFKCGRLLVAQGINSRIADNLEFSKFIVNALNRHVSCDWGEMDEEDKQENDYALDKYLRLFSAYELNDQEKIWIITEADRSATTILFPDEY
ncbi:hypothetical protein LCGC14_1984840 [marine sediment metagenome]|uniref:Type I restriction endonuclease subunit M n=1 Tax=marine sediment metagenome TaxID=412755 RepID=A0A0F9I4W8_9ZZZZ